MPKEPIFDKTKEYKLSIRVPEEFYNRFREIAKRYGLTQNQLGSMAMQSGIKNIVRALSPEDAFTPGQLAEIIKALDERGIEVSVPERKEKDESTGTASEKP